MEIDESQSSQQVIKLIELDEWENFSFEHNILNKIKLISEGEISTNANSSSTVNRESFSEIQINREAGCSKISKSMSKVDTYQKFCLTHTREDQLNYCDLQFVNHEIIQQPMSHNVDQSTVPDSDLSKSCKGRKRKQYSKYSNLRELIEQEAIPQWVKYLKNKMVCNEEKETGITPRDDTIWKKMFRDLREFFRILFKARFHPLDYKTWEQADSWCKVLLEELGIDTSHLKPYDLRKTFYFFHQTRLNSSDHYSSDYVEKEGEIFAMDIIEKYKDSLKALFMVDPVSSKLFYFLYYNFDYVYFSFLKEKYRGIIDTIITNTLSCYNAIEWKEDFIKILEWVFSS